MIFDTLYVVIIMLKPLLNVKPKGLMVPLDQFSFADSWFCFFCPSTERAYGHICRGMEENMDNAFFHWLSENMILTFRLSF